MDDETRRISSSLDSLENVKDIQQAMAAEGRIWDTYYQGLNKFVPEKFRFETGAKSPRQHD